MSRPLKERLPGSEPSAAAVDRVWHRVNERHLKERDKKRSYVPFVALASAALACVTFIFILRPSPCDQVLCTANGEPFQLAFSGDASELQRELTLNDRSSLVLTARTVASVTANAPTIVELEINTGKVIAHVQPMGPRRWGITAGDVRVEVVGTTFSVERAATFVRVEVSEGVVQVSGPGVKGGVQRLRAGEFFDSTPRPKVEVTIPAQPSEAQPPQGASKGRALPPKAAPSTPTNGTTENEATTAKGNSPPPHVETWRTLAEKGQFNEASALLGVEGLAKEAQTAVAADLILLADIAEHRGDTASSERILARVATQTATNAEHAIAEYKRGIRFLARGDAVKAAECLERALDFGLPQALEANAVDRAVEAWRAAGNTDKARALRGRKSK